MKHTDLDLDHDKYEIVWSVTEATDDSGALDAPDEEEGWILVGWEAAAGDAAIVALWKRERE